MMPVDLPMTHDLPIDVGLETFCENCNKCARECPSGAITAGPKRMFNGYEHPYPFPWIARRESRPMSP